MQRPLARALGAALVLLMAAIPAGAQDKPRSGGELVFVVPSEPPSYDAHQEETFGVIHPVAPHYSTLLRHRHQSGFAVDADLTVKAFFVSFDFRRTDCETVSTLGKLVATNTDWRKNNGHPQLEGRRRLTTSARA